MIVRQSQIHHRTDNYLTVDCHWTLKDVVHAQDRGLRRVNDRGRHHRTESTTVGDSESTTGHFVDRQFAVTGFFTVGSDAAFDFSQAHQFGVTQNRNHQTTVAGNSYTDIGEAVVNNVGTVDRGVNGREAFQCFGSCFHEERHEAQAYAVVGLLEQVLVLRTQCHDFSHVHFVKSGQHRHVRLRFNQTLGHGGTNAGHRNAFFYAVASSEYRSGSGRCSGLGRRSSRSGFFGSYSGNYVFLGHTTAFASTGNGSDVDTVFFSDLARSRCGNRIVFTIGSRSSSLGSRCSGSRRGGSSSATFNDGAQHFVGQNGVAFVLDDSAQHAVSSGQYFQHYLVGFDINDQVVALYSVARLLVPGGNGAIGNRFRKCWGFDLDSHVLWFLKFGFSARRR